MPHLFKSVAFLYLQIAYAILCTHDTIDQLNARSQGYLPGRISIECISTEPGRLTSRLAMRPELLPAGLTGHVRSCGQLSYTPI